MRVIVTGAARGIGAECVKILRSKGHHVTALDIVNPEDVDRWIPCDLGDSKQIVDAVSHLEGTYDALINNAGLPPRADNSTDVLRVNVFGLIEATRRILPYMSDGSSIVSTASRAGKDWRENFSQVEELLSLGSLDELQCFVSKHQISPLRAYNLSKESIIVWSIFAIEDLLERKIRINTVSPGPISTEILDEFVSAFGERAETAISHMGRAGSANEVAELLVFLVSSACSWLNGQDIMVDGGLGALQAIDDIRSKGLSCSKLKLISNPGDE